MSRVTKKNEANVESETLTKETRLTWTQLAERLSFGRIELSDSETLVIHQIDPSDFITLVEEPDPAKRLRQFAEIMQRYSIEVVFEGSIMLGAFNISDASWTITPGEGKYLQISTKPLTMRKTLPEIVSFLKKLPLGQGWALKPSQKLFIEELSSDAMFSYYQRCQSTTDSSAQEAEQDLLFTASCETLENEGLVLKVYGMNVASVNRTIDTSAAGILFTPEGNTDLVAPRIVMGLVAKK